MSRDIPEFTGITTYRDPAGRYSFRYPWDWQAEPLDEGRDGIILKPDLNDPDTHFAAWSSQLDVPVTAADLADLDASFDEGMKTLPELRIVSTGNDTFGNIVRLERLFTYTHDKHTCQRRVWAIYAAQMQLVLIYQGSTPDLYRYWLPMGNYCYATLELPETTWLTTDPELRAERANT